MNIAYWLFLLLSLALCTAWLAVRANKRGMKLAPVFTGVLLGAVLAFVVAKALYTVLLSSKVWPRYGWASLIRLEASEFSFIGGCLGMVLGMVISARLHKIQPASLLSLFAPVGAFMTAGARVAEVFLDMQGAGKLVEIAFFERIPFAVQSDWNQLWFWAVFFLEALFALIAAVIFSVWKKGDAIVSLRFERVVYYLCVPQIFCESLRALGMRWGFVRIEQVLCGVIIEGLLIYGCLQYTGAKGFWKRFWPCFAALGCVVVIVGVEFGLDKVPSVPDAIWYCVMIAALVGFAALERFVTGRRLRQVKQA